mgnify:CR=1 FL=1
MHRMGQVLGVDASRVQGFVVGVLCSVSWLAGCLGRHLWYFMV